MKHMKKWLALLMAGMMITASLFACSDNGSEPDDDDKEEESEKSFDEYKKLSPEEVFEALEDAEQFVFKFVQESEDEKFTVTFERDGDAAKFSSKDDSDDETVIYFDVKEGIKYTEDEDGKYEAASGEGNKWEGLYDELLDEFIRDNRLDFLMSDDSYEKEGSTYTLVEDAFEELFENSMVESAEGYMERSLTEYVFVFNAENEEGDEFEFKYTISFEETSVKLPEAEIEDEGEDEDGDDSNGGESSVETRAPVTTAKPETTAKPVEPEVPDVLDEDDLEEGMLSPEALYDELSDIGKLTFRATSTTDDGTVRVIMLNKYNDSIKIEETADGETAVYYFDFDKKLQYFEMDGTWYVSDENADEMNWDALFESMCEEVFCGTLEAPLSDFTYDERACTLTMTEEALEESDGLGSVSYIYYPVDDTYSVIMTNDDGDTELKVMLAFEAASVQFPENAIDPNAPAEPAATYLTPSGLYTKLADAQTVRITIESTGVYATYGRDYDRLALLYGTTKDDAMLIYRDMRTGDNYVQSGESWTKTAGEPITWAEFLDTANLTSDFYAFMETYYNTYTDSDTTLTVKDSVLSISGIESAELTRSEYEYCFTEVTEAGVVTRITFNFEPGYSIALPAAE